MATGPDTIYPLESAGFDSWPALETETHAGWLLRFGKGYTKRANSANAGELAQALTTDDIQKIEIAYRARGLPPTFRIISAPALTTTDSLLIERGYRFTDLSLVMTAPMEAPEPSGEITLMSDISAWLDLFQEISGKPMEGRATHLEILSRIKCPAAYAVSVRDGQPVSCGLAVIANGALGLFDIATAQAHRGQGLARKMCCSLLAWGWSKGAHTRYLQVVGNNTAAIHLYESLGYRYAYHYWYRIAPR